jgi:hypothetical protein
VSLLPPPIKSFGIFIIVFDSSLVVLTANCIAASGVNIKGKSVVANVVPPSRPLVAMPSRPLVVRRLIFVWPPSNDAATIERPPAFAAATAVAAVGGGTATTVVELTIVHCQKERGSSTTTTSIPAAAQT